MPMRYRDWLSVVEMCFGFSRARGVVEMASKTKRKYYRKCGVCGCRHEQYKMVRHDGSPNGWFCIGCWIDYEDPEWEDE